MKALFSIFRIFILAIAINASFAHAGNVAGEAHAEELPDSSISLKEYLAGEFSVRNNDFETAAKLFEKALIKSPDNQVIIQNTYKSMLLSGNYSKAARYAEEYLTYDKNSPNALLVLAIYSVSQGNFQQASSILDGIAPNTDKRGAVGMEQLLMPFIRMWIIAGEGNIDVALNSIDQHDTARIISGTFISLQKALLYSIAGDNDDAEKIFSELLKEKGVLPYHLAKSAASFYESIGNWDEAGRIYTQYHTQHPSSPHFGKAQIRVQNKITNGLYIKNPKDGLAEVMKETTRLLFSSELFSEGLVYLRLALMLKPQDEEALLLFANFEEEKGRWQQAIDFYDKISKDSELYVSSQINKAEDLYRLGKKAEAKKILLTSAEQIKDKYIPLVTLADLLRKDNKFKEAIEIYTQVLTNIDPKKPSSWAIFFARGICYERIGKWKQAEAELQTALELNPNQPEVINYLAYSWLEHNVNLEKARDMLIKAAVKRPNDPQILDSAGWALYKTKDYNNAVVFLEKASEMLPQDAVINDHLGDVYWMQGRRYEARYAWQRSIKYGPPESSTKEKLERKIAKGLEK